MQRRFALAISLALTTVVTFGIIVVGAQAGFFNGHKGASAEQVSAGPLVQNTAPPRVSDAQPAANQDPLVVTDYVYIDQTPVPIRVRATRATSSTAPPPQGLTAQSKPTTPSSSDATQPGDPTQPAKPSTGDPSPAAVPPASAPPSQPVAPSATALAPTASPQPAPTSTAAPPSPTSAPGLPGEIEFVGTVTAISGNMITFAHDSTTTVVRLSLQVAMGQRLHVHALLQAGVYVATELEGD